MGTPFRLHHVARRIRAPREYCQRGQASSPSPAQARGSHRHSFSWSTDFSGGCRVGVARGRVGRGTTLSCKGRRWRYRPCGIHSMCGTSTPGARALLGGACSFFVSAHVPCVLCRLRCHRTVCPAIGLCRRCRFCFSYHLRFSCCGRLANTTGLIRPHPPPNGSTFLKVHRPGRGVDAARPPPQGRSNADL